MTIETKYNIGDTVFATMRWANRMLQYNVVELRIRKIDLSATKTASEVSYWCVKQDDSQPMYFKEKELYKTKRAADNAGMKWVKRMAEKEGLV